MSFANTISLLFREPKGVIGDVTFDAVLSESHDLQNDVTEHPVEPGSGIGSAADAGQPSSVSDNVRRKADVITITGVISNTPASGPGSFLGIPLVRGIAGLASARTLDQAIEVENSIASKGFNDLVAIRDEGRLVDVLTKFKKYKNMVITSLSVNQDSTTGSALSCSVTLKEIRLVESVLVPLPPQPKLNRAKKQVSKGTQPPQKPDATKALSGKEFIDQFIWRP